MLSKEEKDRLIDYFEAGDLVELLRIPVADIVDAFEEEIEEALDDLNDIMEYGNDRSERD